ncbi:DUF2235 domain-containing protein [Candidatus Woesearchaeota archaeon]|nr:DUF2235 domain-containing protein [Candidatus Woesearchaeota archaeon]
MTDNKLNLLGLTRNEIRVYKSILKGAITGTQIKKYSAIANSQVYIALGTLITKGLVTYNKTSKGKRYYATDPLIIKKLAEEQSEKIQEVIPYLQQIQQHTIPLTDTAIYEGYAGFKTALYKLAEECPEKETINIIGFSNQAYKNKKLAALLRDVNKISAQKKHKFRMILDNKKNTFYSQRKEEKISNIRFMGRNFTSPAAIDIFQDSVYILLWDEHPYAIVIHNKNISIGFKMYFEFLWKMAKQ